MNRTFVLRRIALAASVAGAAVVLAACGTQAGATPAAAGNQSAGMANMPATNSGSASFNGTDVAFAQMMIPDHQMVAKMAKLAAGKASSAALKTLATQLQKGQPQTVDMLQSMLKTWGKSSDTTGMTMPGAMTEQDMTMLKSMKGMNFDMMFAQIMIKHHEASIKMAQDEQTKGANADAKAMAGEMMTTQKAQVEKLRKITQM